MLATGVRSGRDNHARSGPAGDNGLSGKKLVAQAYGSAVPIGGGAVHGKDRHKVDPRGQALARRMALDLVLPGKARETTVWLAYRPGDVEPWRMEIATSPGGRLDPPRELVETGVARC